MIRQKFIVDTALYCNLVTAGSTDRASDAPDSLAVYRCADVGSPYDAVLLSNVLFLSQPMLKSGEACQRARSHITSCKRHAHAYAPDLGTAAGTSNR